MGDFLIWLSGVSRQLLGQCTTERPKFIGLGAAILVTAGMAAVSLSFALVSALKAPVWLAVFFALLWGLAIMSLDRLFVVSMHRQRNGQPWTQAADRRPGPSARVPTHVSATCKFTCIR